MPEMQPAQQDPEFCHHHSLFHQQPPVTSVCTTEKKFQEEYYSTFHGAPQKQRPKHTQQSYKTGQTGGDQTLVIRQKVEERASVIPQTT